MKRMFAVLMAVLMLAAVFAGCQSAPEQEKTVPLMEQVAVKSGDGYRFAETDWTMTKEAVMKKLNVTPETVEKDAPDRFTVPVHIDGFDTDGWATYVFIDETKPLGGGWYAFQLKGEFEAIRKQIREMAVRTLAEPAEEQNGGTGAAKSATMLWRGKDGSVVSVDVAAKGDGDVEDGKESVDILLNVSAPQPAGT